MALNAGPAKAFDVRSHPWPEESGLDLSQGIMDPQVAPKGMRMGQLQDRERFSPWYNQAAYVLLTSLGDESIGDRKVCFRERRGAVWLPFYFPDLCPTALQSLVLLLFSLERAPEGGLLEKVRERVNGQVRLTFVCFLFFR